MLKELNLNYCTSLEKVNFKESNLPKLEELKMECVKMIEFPIMNLQNLKKLTFDESSILQLRNL